MQQHIEPVDDIPVRRVTVPEAAQILGVGKQTIRDKINSGELRADRVFGRMIRIRIDELERVAQPITKPGDAA